MASPSVGSLVVAVVAPVSELLVEVGFVVVQFAEAPANAVPESAVWALEESELLPEAIKLSVVAPILNGKSEKSAKSAKSAKQFSSNFVRSAVAGESFVVLSQAVQDPSAQSFVFVESQVH